MPTLIVINIVVLFLLYLVCRFTAPKMIVVLGVVILVPLDYFGSAFVSGLNRGREFNRLQERKLAASGWQLEHDLTGRDGEIRVTGRVEVG